MVSPFIRIWVLGMREIFFFFSLMFIHVSQAQEQSLAHSTPSIHVSLAGKWRSRATRWFTEDGRGVHIGKKDQVSWPPAQSFV